MGIEPTSSAWKADILADVLYPQLQKELYHNFVQMSSTNLGVAHPLSLAARGSSPKGTPFGYIGKFTTATKAVPLGKVARRSRDGRGSASYPLSLLTMFAASSPKGTP